MHMASAVRTLSPPLYFTSRVVMGFQRGSKELGWPTANLENTPQVRAALDAAETGVYCGWAVVGSAANAAVYKAAISIGWNPTFKGKDAVKQKMIEPYLLHEFEEDFYGEAIRLVVCGYIRPELDFSAAPDFMQALRDAIGSDVKLTAAALEEARFQSLLPGKGGSDDFLSKALSETDMPYAATRMPLPSAADVVAAAGGTGVSLDKASLDFTLATAGL